MSRVILAFYLVALALLPWGWFPPFPWLHEHAQWSDVVFAATFALWIIEKWREGKWPRFGPLHVAMGLYLLAAASSLLFASPNKLVGAFKLIGMVELCALAVVTADLAARERVPRLIGRAIVVTSLLTAAAALAGLALFYAGSPTRLIGVYGDLVYSPWYARVQAGTDHPNMLASFCLFASAVVAWPRAELPVWLRRVTQAALLLTVALTFSRGILAFILAAAIRAARTRTQRRLVVCYTAACVALIAALTIWNFSINPARPFEARLSAIPSSRWQTITTSLRTLAAHPLTGSGTGIPPGHYRGIPFDAHLTPLNIAATMGLPALAAFIALFVILWRGRPRPILLADLAIWSGLAGLALDALASDVEDFRHLWVLIGLAPTGNDK